MGIVSGVVAFLHALPQLLRILAKLGEILGSNETKAMLTDLEKAVDGLKNSKTTEARLKETRKLVDIVGNLRG